MAPAWRGYKTVMRRGQAARIAPLPAPAGKPRNSPEATIAAVPALRGAACGGAPKGRRRRHTVISCARRRRRGMNRYSHADRTALTGAARRLLGHCDCYGKSAVQEIGGPGIPAGCAMGMTPDTMRICLNDGTTYCAFEPGARIEVSPTGQARHYRAPPGGRFGGDMVPPENAPVEAVDISGMARADPEPAGAGLEGTPPEAPLPAAFRMHRLARGKAAKVQFDVPAGGPGEAGARVVRRDVGELPVGHTSRARSSFEGTLPSYARDLEFVIEKYEDDMCLAQLEGLGEAGETYTCRGNSTLGELAGFVSRLNSGRPRMLHFDTVLVNYGMYLTLFGNDTRTPSWAMGYPLDGDERPYRNMTTLGGITFLHHPRIPSDAGFALSSRQGPVFVHGPSSIRCTEEAIVTRRQCGIAKPPLGTQKCPWGVRFGAEMNYGADGAMPDGE